MISDEQLNSETPLAQDASDNQTPVASEQEVEIPTSTSANDAPQAGHSDSNGSETGATEKPAREKRTPKARPDRKRERREKPKRQSGGIFKKFAVVIWSGRREPVDDMYWVEAEREGDWIVVREFEQIRTRREILERLQELPSGLVAVDFNLSYPKDFIELVRMESGIKDWKSLAKKVREDLKKNADDGVRHWIERMGKYRESNLDPEPPRFPRRDDRQSNDRRDRFQRDRFAGERRIEPLPPYEQPSLAERFRRTDLALKRAAEGHLTSPIQIGYNRLTNRYEFNDPAVRGRAALLGLSMLDQLLDARPEAAVWPMMRPRELTIVEVLPWTFTSGKTLAPDVLRKTMAVHEDNGWDIPDHAIDLAARNPDAQRALLCLMGMIKTETRENRERRPIRDYVDAFYEDPQVNAEGWFYSVGYRVMEDRTQMPPPELGQERPSTKPLPKEEPETTSADDNPIVMEASAVVTEHQAVPPADEVAIAEEVL